MTPGQKPRPDRDARPPGPGSGFADRLNWLFGTIHPLAGPYSNAHVVRVIKGNPEKYGSVSLTEQYLSQLRKGQRTAPSDETKRAVALFFGIPVGWLLGELDPAAARQVENEVQLLALALRDEGVKSIALRSFGLPSEMQNLVLGLLGQMRGQAGLPGDHEAEG